MSRAEGARGLAARSPCVSSSTLSPFYIDMAWRSSMPSKGICPVVQPMEHLTSHNANKLKGPADDLMGPKGKTRRARPARRKEVF